MDLQGYGTRANLGANVLKIDATNAAGRGALGASAREIPISEITAVAFKDASMLGNGRITIQSDVGVTVIHFLKRATTDARALFEALLDQSAVSPASVPIGGFANEKNSARGASVAARRAELDKQHAEDFAAWRTARAESDATFKADIAENKAQFAEGNAQFKAQFAEGNAKFKAGIAENNATFKADMAAIKSELAEALAKSGFRATGRTNLREITELLDAAERESATGWDGSAADGPDPDSPDAATDDSPEPNDSSIETRVGTLLDLAEEAGGAGDIVQEELRIAQALVYARKAGRRTDRKAAEASVRAREAKGTLRTGSTLLGEVVAESGFSQYARTQSLTKIVSGERRITVRSDRVLAGGSVRRLDEFTSAQVYLDGQEQITQRPTLTRMLLLSPLPGSTLIPGLAFQKKTTHDLRRAEFQIGSVGWSFRAPVDPDRVNGVRQLAEQANRAAAAIGNQGGQEDAPAAMPPVSAVDAALTQLERLQYLVEKGSISTDEAERVRAAILEQRMD